MQQRLYERVKGKYIGRYIAGTDPELDEVASIVGEITGWVYRVVRHLKKEKRKKTEWFEVNEVYYCGAEPVILGMSLMSEDRPDDLAINLEMRTDAFKQPILTYDDDKGEFVNL